MNNKPSILLIRALFSMLIIFVFGFQQLSAQFTLSPESGAFGIFGGVVLSELGQIAPPASTGLSHQLKQGFEVGVKKEIYRSQWLKGNLYASYLQLGSQEYYQEENIYKEATVDLKAIKVALTPLLLKVGGDFVHGYAGGGMYGTYFIEQSVSSPLINGDDYWSNGPELEKIDYGLNLLAGFHLWNFQLEFHAQYGKQKLGDRFDGSVAKQEFYSLTLAYMFINRDITRKSCKDTRFL